jgi:hypothetical protein
MKQETEKLRKNDKVPLLKRVIWLENSMRKKLSQREREE